GPISLSGQSGVTISDKDFNSLTGNAAITLTNCSNIKIVNCNFTNIPSTLGLQLTQCSNIEIVNCSFDTFYGGVYAYKCTGGLNIHCNSFKAIVGPKPRGQIVQFNSCTGGGNRINYNILDHKLSSTMIPEDLINVYASQGLAGDPIQIVGNNLRGGGPSTTGGGIMVGDNGGKHILVQDNILVDPGQYGIGVPAGEDIVIRNNKIYAKQQSFTNVGLYVGLSSEIASGFPCTGSTIVVDGNQVNWTNKNGVKNGWYYCSCCPGVTLTNNNFNASFGPEILPAVLSLNSAKCGTTVTPPPVNKAPSVSITAPATGAAFIAPASITISASASDADGTISKVDFYNGSTLLFSDAASPYSCSWNNVAAGSYTITAKATDNAGATSSASVSVIVNSAPVNKAPVASITSPASGTSFLAPASITISASASDADGTVSKVDFYNGALLLGSDVSAPYSFTISAATAGTYTLKAVATDNAGATGSSAAVSVTVSNTGTGPGINGPSCVNPGTAASFTLTAPSGFTSANWWTNAEATITIDPADNRKATIRYSSNVSGNIVLTCGANFNLSPWYKEYTKTIQVGGCATARSAASAMTLDEIMTAPNPFNHQITVSVMNGEKILSIKIYDMNGTEQINSGSLDLEQISLGENLRAGVYIMTVVTENSTLNKRIVKID
ncbi:MAG: Ig-like domain-containing protein, partial [Cytophagaceae bacterium]